MAQRGTRAGPNRRGAAKPGDNSDKSDDAIIRKAAESRADIAARRAAFNLKMKQRHEKEVSGPLKSIGIKMKHAEFYLDNAAMEQSGEDNALQNAINDRALMLDAGRRIHAALHNGEQLDWVKIQKQADKARQEAEEEAGEAEEKADDDGE